jgi:predicted TIM-barrel fold metal-dependent hydrolase
VLFKDINCGYTTLSKPGYYVNTFDDVTKLQNRYNIVESAMYNYSVCAGTLKNMNLNTIEECKKIGSRVPVLHLLPPAYSEESYSKDEMIDLINKVKPLFRVCPGKDASPFLDWMYQWTLDILEESETPLLMSLQDLDLKEVAQTLTSHKRLKVIITNTTQWLNRQYMQAAKQFKNVWIDTSNVIEYYGIENITNILGAERIVFGTNMPEKEPYDKIFQLLFCELAEEQKECIAFRNYDRLVGRNA